MAHGLLEQASSSRDTEQHPESAAGGNEMVRQIPAHKLLCCVRLNGNEMQRQMAQMHFDAHEAIEKINHQRFPTSVLGR